MRAQRIRGPWLCRCRAVACALALLLAEGAARADEAQALLEQGIKHYGQAMPEEALRALSDALAKARTPELKARIHAWLGCVHFGLGQQDLATGNWLIALERDPQVKTEDLHPEARRALARLRQLLPGYITVTTEPAGAEVVLDGSSLGQAPVKRARVVPGPHRLEVRLQHHRPWSGQVEVPAGGEVPVTVKLEPEPVAPAPVAVTPEPSAPEPAEPAGEPTPAAEPEGQARVRNNGLLVAAGVLAGAGAVAGAVAGGLYWQACADYRDARQPEEISEHRTRAERAQTGGIIAGSVLGGAAVVLFVLYLVSGDDRSDNNGDAGQTVGLAPAVAPAGVVVRGRF